MLQLGISDELTRLRKTKESVLTVGQGILHQINMGPHIYEEFTAREIEQTLDEIWNEYTSPSVIEVRPHTQPVISESTLTTTWGSPFGTFEIRHDQNLDIQTPQQYWNYEIRVDTSDLYLVTASSLA